MVLKVRSQELRGHHQLVSKSISWALSKLAKTEALGAEPVICAEASPPSGWHAHSSLSTLGFQNPLHLPNDLQGRKTVWSWSGPLRTVLILIPSYPRIKASYLWGWEVRGEEAQGTGSMHPLGAGLLEISTGLTSNCWWSWCLASQESTLTQKRSSSCALHLSSFLSFSRSRHWGLHLLCHHRQ